MAYQLGCLVSQGYIPPCHLASLEGCSLCMAVRDAPEDVAVEVRHNICWCACSEQQQPSQDSYLLKLTVVVGQDGMSGCWLGDQAG